MNIGTHQIKRTALFCALITALLGSILIPTAIAGEMYGNVYSQYSLEPMVGAEVNVYNYWDINDLLLTVYTDANGAYYLTAIPDGTDVAIEVVPADTQHATQYYYGQPTWDLADLLAFNAGEPALNFDFYLKPKTAVNSLSGTVKNAAGDPVPYAWLYVNSDQLYQTYNHFYYYEIQADQNGAYVFESLYPADDYRVSAWVNDGNNNGEFFYRIPDGEAVGAYVPTGSTLSYSDATIVSLSSPAHLSSIDIIADFTQGGSIIGRVTGPAGNGLAGVWVEAWSDYHGTYSFDTTNETGDYEISGLVIVEAVNAAAEGYEVTAYPDAYAIQNYGRKVATGETGINFSLTAGRAISGVIKDGAGNPVTWTYVDAWSAQTGGFDFAYTDESGAFTLSNLPPALDYIVSFEAEGYPVLYYNGKADGASADLIDLTLSDQTIAISLIGYVAGGAIEGHVKIDGAAPDVDVWVSAESYQSGESYGAYADANGYFKITGLDLSLNDYVLSASMVGRPTAYYATEGATFSYESADRVSPSSLFYTIDYPAGGAIKGAITLNDAYFGGAWVEVYDSVSGAWIFIESWNVEMAPGANYIFEGLAPGSYAIAIDPSNGLDMQTKVVDVAAGQTVTADFVLSQTAGRTIAGAITGLASGEFAIISAWSEREQYYGWAEVTGTGGTADYQINDCPPAPDYVVDIYTDNHPYIVFDSKLGWENATPVDVTDQDAGGINFNLGGAGELVSISGAIAFPAGYGGESVWMEAYAPSVDFYGHTWLVAPATAQSVPYTIEGLRPAGDYRVMVSSFVFPDIYYDNVAFYDDATLVNATNGATGINFQLKEGNAISGRVVSENGAGVSGVAVWAFSEAAGSWGEAITQANGAYTIRGLDAAGDYIVGAWVPDLGDFYYAGDKTARAWERALPVSTLGAGATGINMTLSQGQRITGRVFDENGKGVADIWVSAWSDRHMTGNGAYTAADGGFTIKGLPEGNDYTVRADPNYGSAYLPAENQNISSCGVATCPDVRLTLRLKGATFTVNGVVTDASGPLANVVVEVWSDSLFGYGGYGWDITDDSGAYAIAGLVGGDDYVIMAWPPESAALAPTAETNLTLSTNITRNIALEAAQTISGAVTLAGGGPAVKAWVFVYSEAMYYWGEAQTGADGSYIIKNVPVGITDGIAMAYYTDYVESIETGVQSGATGVNFTLTKGGAISGMVTGNGQPLSDALVEVTRVANGATILSEGARAGVDGRYVIDGLPEANDYIVTAMAAGFPSSTQTGKSTGEDKVNFSLASDANNVLSGRVNNIGDTALAGTYVVVNAFTSGKYVTYEEVQSNGDFRFATLAPNTPYRLQFVAYYENPTTDPYKYNQWAADDGAGGSIGVINATDPFAPPTSAMTFRTGGTVGFRFDTPLVGRRTSLLDKGPGRVRNVRSTTTGDIPGLSRTTTERVSKNPNVTIKWDATATGAAEKYYYVFNKDANHVIDKRNARKPAIAARTVTSHALSGDNAPHYAHVAAEDDRGRIGPTAHLDFIIDTVAPKNPKVEAAATARSGDTSKVTLTLGATGATEIYISNTGYGANGQWEPFTDSKQWRLAGTGGRQTIYVQFRDEAKNVSQALYAFTGDVAGIGPLSSAVIGLKVIAGIEMGITTAQYDAAGSAIQDGVINMKDVIYHLQKAASLR